MKHRWMIAWLIATIATLAFTHTIQAQEPENAVVVYPVVESTEDSLNLNVFFTITDQDGQPIPDTTIETGFIQLQDEESVPLPVTFNKPNTPYHIVLLLDGSGSMHKVIDTARQVVIEAIDSAPPTARFAVIQFNQTSREVLPNFEADHQLVKNAISQVQSEEDSGTCLYNSLVNAINILQNHPNASRQQRAIILLTDGKDELAKVAGRCSSFTYDEVITKATSDTTPNIPIHTIGLCENDVCTNINQNELMEMADETNGFSAIGEEAELDDLFKGIMTNLGVQWVAQAKIFPKKGEHLADLNIRLQGDTASLNSTSFRLSSPTSYEAPTGAYITDVVYNLERDIYNVSMSVLNHTEISQLILQVWDRVSGEQLLEQVFENPSAILQFEQSATSFVLDQNYLFQIRALDEMGQLIALEAEKQSKGISDEREITHRLPEPEPAELTIDSVDASYDTNELIINLRVEDESDIISYEGVIFNQDTGEQVGLIDRELFESIQLRLRLPQAIQSAETQHNYQIKLALTKQDETTLEAEYLNFSPIPLTSSERLALIASRPIVFGSVLGVMWVMAAVTLVYRIRSHQRDIPLPSSEPLSSTNQRSRTVTEIYARPSQVVTGQMETQPDSHFFRFKLEVEPTFNQPGIEQIIDYSYGKQEFTIGRSNCDFNIPYEHISENHVKFTLREGRYYIVDMGSQHGTFVGEKRLPVNQPTFIPLTEITVINLGLRTELKIEPMF